MCRPMIAWFVFQLLVVPANATAAQTTSRNESARPVLLVSASAEVEVAPDRAFLSVAVQSRGRTAVEAATANARSQSAVIEAVRRAGVPSSQLRTTALSVSPEYEYPREGGRPTVVGYAAQNSVEIEIRDLPTIGPVLDAAISVGATTVHGPRFAIADESVARRSALEAAVRKARADAEAIAGAAGVRLGAVLEIISGGADGRTPDPQMAMAEILPAGAARSIGSPVESGRLTVRAGVSVRFAIENP